MAQSMNGDVPAGRDTVQPAAASDLMQSRPVALVQSARMPPSALVGWGTSYCAAGLPGPADVVARIG
jgi:hypothetical protein